MGGVLRVGAQERDCLAIAGSKGPPLNSLPRSERSWHAAGSGSLPKVPPGPSALIGIEQNSPRAGRERHKFHFETAGGKQLRLAAFHRHAIQVRPPIAFPGKDQPAVNAPEE